MNSNKIRFAVVPAFGSYTPGATVRAVSVHATAGEASELARDGSRIVQTVTRTAWYGWEMDRVPSVAG